MKNHVLAKIGGWAQFGLQILNQVATSGTTPHGAAQWLQLAASLAAAVGIHIASNTAGSNTPTTN